MSDRFSPLFDTRDEALTYVKARTRGQTGDYNWTNDFMERVVDGIESLRERFQLEAHMESMSKVAEFDIPNA